VRVPGGVNCKGNVYKFPSVQDSLISKNKDYCNSCALVQKVIVAYGDCTRYENFVNIILLIRCLVWRDVSSVLVNAVWTEIVEKKDIVVKVTQFAWQELPYISGRNLALRENMDRVLSFFPDAV
jgi:hypothetical protein